MAIRLGQKIPCVVLHIGCSAIKCDMSEGVTRGQWTLRAKNLKMMVEQPDLFHLVRNKKTRKKVNRDLEVKWREKVIRGQWTFKLLGFLSQELNIAEFFYSNWNNAFCRCTCDFLLGSKVIKGVKRSNLFFNGPKKVKYFEWQKTRANVFYMDRNTKSAHGDPVKRRTINGSKVKRSKFQNFFK